VDPTPNDVFMSSSCHALDLVPTTLAKEVVTSQVGRDHGRPIKSTEMMLKCCVHETCRPRDQSIVDVNYVQSLLFTEHLVSRRSTIMTMFKM